jgi:hypothetical protein
LGELRKADESMRDRLFVLQVSVIPLTKYWSLNSPLN